MKSLFHRPSPVKPICDHCKMRSAEYDAVIPSAGVWANLCQRCFDLLGCKLGTGCGQKNGGAR